MGNCVPGGKNDYIKPQELAKLKGLIHAKQYNLLRMIYFDLGARDKSHSLTIENFLLFFHKNGYWGNRLFKQFDADKSNLIHEGEFIKGIVRIFKTSEEQKIQLLYKFFSNGRRDKGVHYNEFLTMLYNYPKEQIKNILNDEDFINKELRSRLIAIDSDYQGHRLESVCPGDILNTKISKTKFKLEDNDSSDRLQSKIGKDILKQVGNKPADRSNTTLKLKVGNNDVEVQTSSVHNIVKKFAKTIFKEYQIDTKTGTLQLKQFTDWMLKHKKLYNDYYDGFHNQIWEIDKETKKPLYMNKKPQFLSKARMELASIKDKPVVITLLHSILIVCEDSDLQNPILIICLEGLAAKPIFKENHGYGIQISHREGIYQNRIFYFLNQNLQKQWMQNLKYFKGSSISQLFQMGEKIGIGKFSIVYSCRQKATGDAYAIKVIESYKLNQEQKRIIAHESSIMSILSHPLMVSFKQSIQTKTHIYIVTELVNGKDLYQLIREFKYLGEAESAYIIKQVIIAVRYLHSLGIVHRDLKPENIMVEYDEKKGQLGKIRIIDFGFANYLSTITDYLKSQRPEVRQEILAGTPNYIAPELLYASQGEHAVITPKMDNFSIGSILYMMLSGTFAFGASSTPSILRKTMQGSFVLNDRRWKKVSDHAKNLVSALLQVEPEDRISLQDALKHPWFESLHQKGEEQHLISFQLHKKQ